MAKGRPEGNFRVLVFSVICLVGDLRGPRCPREGFVGAMEKPEGHRPAAGNLLTWRVSGHSGFWEPQGSPMGPPLVSHHYYIFMITVKSIKIINNGG